MRSFIHSTLVLSCWLLVGGISTADDDAGKTPATTSVQSVPAHLPQLIKELRTSGCAMPASAAQLVGIGKPAVPALIELLDAPNWVPRWKAARVLGLMGPEAKEALPALEKALQREKPHVFERQFLPLAIAAIKVDTKPLIDCVEGKTKSSDAARGFAAELLRRVRLQETTDASRTTS